MTHVVSERVFISSNDMFITVSSHHDGAEVFFSSIYVCYPHHW